MKTTFLSLMLLIAISACKKDGALNTGNTNEVPPHFYFVIADNQGKSLLTSTADAIEIFYQVGGSMVAAPTNYPQKTMTTTTIPSTDYIVADGIMAQKSEEGIKTFYLTYKGKTDTLGLDIRKIPATPDNGGNSTPVVTFNGRPMQSVDGKSILTQDYFILRRR